MNKTITFLAKDIEKKIRLDKFLTKNLENSRSKTACRGLTKRVRKQHDYEAF